MSTGIIPLDLAQVAVEEKQASKEGYLTRDLIALDQGVNVLTDGLPDETISSRLARDAQEGHVVGKIGSKVLDLFQKNHGADAQAGDLERAHAVAVTEKSSGDLE